MAEPFVDIDFRAWASTIREDVPAALDQATRMKVNRTAFKSVQALHKATEENLDRPTAFTKKAWRLSLAKTRKGRRGSIDTRIPEATVEAGELQAAYLRYVIYGGERHPEGGRKWLYIPSAGGIPTDEHGNLPRGSVAQLARAAFGARGEKRKSRVFFGTLRNRPTARGFWLRPLRTEAERGPDGRVHRFRGVVNVRDIGPPKLLVRASSRARYTRRLIPYDDIVRQADAETRAEFAVLLAQALRRHSRTGSRRGSIDG